MTTPQSPTPAASGLGELGARWKKEAASLYRTAYELRANGAATTDDFNRADRLDAVFGAIHDCATELEALAAQPAPGVGGEAVGEIRYAMEQARDVCREVFGMAMKVGPIYSKANTAAWGLSAALKHLDALSTRPAESVAQGGEVPEHLEDVLHRLDEWCRAYPESVFPEPTDEDVAAVNSVYPNAVTRISASMGRHMVKHMREMANVIRATPAPATGSGGEAITAEVVGVVRDDEDGGHVEWLIEGGLCDLRGAHLYVMDMPVPEDGAAELFTHPAQAGGDREVNPNGEVTL